MSEPNLFVVVAEQGEYEQRGQWIAAVYINLAEAEQVVRAKTAQANADRAAHYAWCDKRAPFYFELAKARNAGLLTAAEEASIVEKIGPKPNDGWEADEFKIVAVPLCTWGRFE